MTKKTNNLSASLRQKIQNIIHQEDGFSFIEVIIVIAMILILSAILIPSYFGFVESAREANVKISAQNMYTAVQMAKLELGSLEDSKDLFVELKKLNPNLAGINASDSDKTFLSADTYSDNENVGDDPYDISDFNENACVISSIEETDFGFTFTYYQYMNGIVYFVKYNDGVKGEIESFKQPINSEGPGDDFGPGNAFGDQEG